ncbi:MAG: zinc-dependent alcohol dehydrogenase [Candidatus Krumholzibacteriia bacterium]
MKAVCWNGVHDVRVETVPDPAILNPRDAIVEVTTTTICGSDLHLYDGHIPAMQKGDILGHEFMGRVVEVGTEVKNLKTGDRVVVPFPISCGKCWFCRHDLWSLCDNSNPKSWMAEALFGHAPAGIFGYSHLMGGYAGGQAEYVRVPFADVGPLKIENDGLRDEQVLFLSDVFPTGYQAAESGNIHPGDVVAVWGCGPVGQFAIRSAFMLGAERVIAIDLEPDRLHMAAEAGAEVVDVESDDVVEVLKELTGGRGPDICIEAVGMEAHGMGVIGAVDRVKQSLHVQTGRPSALRQAIQACRKGGTLSVAGVFGGFLDMIPMGAAFNKGLTFRMGQTHVHRYLKPLFERIEKGEIDPSFVVSHALPLEEAPMAYRIFRDKVDGCTKVVLKTASA